jgi:hypothetical protein
MSELCYLGPIMIYLTFSIYCSLPMFRSCSAATQIVVSMLIDINS